MNDETPSQACSKHCGFLPILVLALSFISFVGWQISNLNTQRKAMEDAQVRQDQMVGQSHQAQAALQKLASDLIEAAQTDDTAKAIVQKYGIQMNGSSTLPAGTQ